MKKNKRGITLIALIITIIVMLILVAVTVTIANDKENGLFERARTASKDTQKEADRETLLTAVVGAYDANNQEVKKDELEANLGNGWQVAEETNCYKVTSPNKNEFKVNIKNATIENNNDGESQDNQEIVGTYVRFGSEDKFQVTAGGKVIYDGEGSSVPYTYDKNSKVIKFTIPPSSEGSDPDNYEIPIWIIKDDEGNIINKLMLDFDLKGLWMTNGVAGLASYRIADGTYIHSNDESKVVISTKEDSNGNKYGFFDDGDQSIYVCKDGYIYTSWGGYRVMNNTQFCSLNDDGTDASGNIYTMQ